MDTAASGSRLKAGTVYAAGDRFVCASISCAGSTAAMSGRTIDGQRLREIDARDIAEWASYDLGALRCECGAVTATMDGGASALVADRGWGDWWLTDPGLAPTRVTQQQADTLARLEAIDVGSSDVRFGDATGDLLANLADGRWIEIGEDGSYEDVTEAVIG